MGTAIVTLLLLTGPSVTYTGSLSTELRSPARVCLAPDGTVLVTDAFYDHVARFDAAGGFLGTWPVPEGPLGIAAHPDGRYFVSLRDTAQVAIYDATFTRVGYLGAGNPQVAFLGPTDIAIASGTGKVYVVDPPSDKVYGFAADGSLALKLGVRGGSASQFRFPSALTIDEPRNRLIVADHDNFRIQVFTTSGIFQLAFGDRNKYYPNGNAEGWVPRTQGLAVDGQGRMYVADAMMSTVRVFGTDGTELAKVLQYGTDPGDLRTPCDLALSAGGGRLYVVNTNAGQVEVYNVSGPPALQGALAVGKTALRGPQAATPVFDEPDAATIRARLGMPPLPPEQGEPRTNYTGPHFIESPIICGRCHGIRQQPGGHEGMPEGQFVLCTSCHSAGGQGLGTPIEEKDLADPYGTNPDAADGRGRSHAWNVAAINANADSVGPTPGGAMAQYLTNGQMKCATCHNTHNSDAGAPYLRISNQHDAMCKECHAPRNAGLNQHGTHPVGFTYPAGQDEFPADPAPLFINDGNVECTTCHSPHYADSGGANAGEGDGMLLRAANDDTLCRTCHTGHVGHTPGGSWQPGCKECHDPHNPSSANLSLVATSVFNKTLGQSKAVVFTARSGPNSFDDGDPAANDGICQVCHTATSYHKHDGSGVPHNDGSTCTDCHPHSAGFVPTGGACDSCHGFPPATGAHTVHFGAAGGGSYGGTGNLSTATAYIFDCGTCHPLSSSAHRNGTVDVELYNAGAPAGSLKALNPPSATYTPGGTSYTDDHGLTYTLGTCSDVYCHSRTDWSSPDPISDPLLDPTYGWPLLDANGNLTYEPYAVTQSKVYSPVNWGDPPQGCNGCHRNNPQTTYPGVQAGVGNSHAWIDDWGYEDLHAWNMGFDPLTCRVCHYETVTAAMTWTRDLYDITWYDDAPIADKSYHVNGVKDVAFDTVDSVTYNTSGGPVTFSLAGMSYDPQTKVCSGTPCHLQQCDPEWGKPYRWWGYSWECDQCHRYSPWPPNPCNGQAAVPRVTHADVPPGSCVTCHTGHRPTPSGATVSTSR